MADKTRQNDKSPKWSEEPAVKSLEPPVVWAFGWCAPLPTFNFVVRVYSINEVMQLIIKIFGAFSESVELTNSVCQVVVQTLTRRLLLTGAVTCYKEIGNNGLVRISKKSNPVMRTILTRLNALLQRTCINQGRNCNPDQQTNHQQLH